MERPDLQAELLKTYLDERLQKASGHTLLRKSRPSLRTRFAAMWQSLRPTRKPSLSTAGKTATGKDSVLAK